MTTYVSLSTPMKPKVALNAQTLKMARDFVFDKWVARARERGEAELPVDLSYSCKFSSLFVQRVFGGTIEANYEHCYNRIDGEIIDLNQFALDVLGMDDPYETSLDFMYEFDFHESLETCIPRVNEWTKEFILMALEKGYGFSNATNTPQNSLSMSR